MRLIVSGSRHADERDRPTVEAGLHRYRQTYEPSEVTLVHGDGTGVDQLAAELARGWGWAVEPHPADWGQCGDGCPPRMHRRVRQDGELYCPFAGPRRNRRMCAAGGDVLVAYPGPTSAGTWQCMRAAASVGIPSQVWPLTTVGNGTRVGTR